MHGLRCVPAIQWFLLFAVLLVCQACTAPGGNQKISKIRLSIQNTLPITREKVPIVLTGTQLRKVDPDFSFKAYSVVAGKAPREVMIPAQADDLDYDGERDQLCFLIDLEPEQTKEISILYDPNVKATLTLDIHKQTRAAIFPELEAVAAMESNLIAYLLKPNGAFIGYGKRRALLFSIDTMFQADLDFERPPSPELRHHFENNGVSLSQQVRITVERPNRQWRVHDMENQEVYFIRKSRSTESALEAGSTVEEQLDIVKSIGLTLNALIQPGTPEMVALNASETFIGCGGVALWDQEAQTLHPLPTEGDYVRILADGSIRSIVQRIIPEWDIQGETRRLISTVFVYGENPWIEHHIHIDTDLPPGYALVTGIPQLSGIYGEDRKQGWVWSWGTDPSDIAALGIALITGSDSTVQDTDGTAARGVREKSILPVALVPDAKGRRSYRAFAVWGGGIDGIATESEFAQHVQTVATALKTPPRIKFLPNEEGEE